MKNFNELFQESSELSDKRNKLFNELKKKFSSEILPEFAELLKKCDYKSCYFKLNTKVFSEEMIKFVDPETDDVQFGIEITNEGKIFSTKIKFVGYGYEFEASENEMKEIRNIGILELIREVNSRTEKYNKKLFDDCAKAESYLK